MRRSIPREITYILFSKDWSNIPQQYLCEKFRIFISRGIHCEGNKVICVDNGAGKSTIFGLITGAVSPEDGEINIPHGLSIATARQVIPRSELDLTAREFFRKVFPKKMYDIDLRIDEVLDLEK